MGERLNPASRFSKILLNNFYDLQNLLLHLMMTFCRLKRLGISFIHYPILKNLIAKTIKSITGLKKDLSKFDCLTFIANLGPYM